MYPESRPLFDGLTRERVINAHSSQGFNIGEPLLDFYKEAYNQNFRFSRFTQFCSQIRLAGRFVHCVRMHAILTGKILTIPQYAEWCERINKPISLNIVPWRKYFRRDGYSKLPMIVGIGL